MSDKRGNIEVISVDSSFFHEEKEAAIKTSMDENDWRLWMLQQRLGE